MPSYNQARFVEAALFSVLNQDYPEKEILFIDGNSTDNTMELIEPYRNRLAVCVSEKDDGQSDALAKGFARATGHILTWLNTDDILLPGTLTAVARTFKENPQCEWVFGNVIWIDAQSTVLKCRKGEIWARAATLLGALTACGPSAFFSRQLYERSGGINRQLHYMMDTELWWRFVLSDANYIRLPGYTWALRLHEDAKMSGHIFSDRNDPKQQRIEAEKAAERAHIAKIRGNGKVLTSRLVAPLRFALKAASPGYVRSFFDSRRWRGRPLGLLLDEMR